MPRPSHFLALLLLLTGFWQSAWSNTTPLKTLTLSCSAPTGSPMDRFFRQLYNQSLEPFGYHVDLRYATPTQELKLMADDQVDGSCARAANIRELRPELTNIVMPKTPSFNVHYHEVRLRTPIRTPNITAIVDNNAALEAYLQQRGEANIARFDNEEKALKALGAGEVHRAILVEIDSTLSMRVSTDARFKSKHYYSMPIHTLLQRRHQHIADLLDRRIPSVLAKLQNSEIHNPRARAHRFANQLDMVCHIPADGPLARSLEKTYKEALKRINYSLNIRYIPRARAFQELKSGRTDMDCARMEYFQKAVEGQVRKIDAPVGSVNLNTYGLAGKPAVSSIKEFTSADRIVHVQGSFYVFDKLKNTEAQVISAPSPLAALKMLTSGRADYYLGFNEETEINLHSNLLSDRIHNLGRISEIPLYPYIHIKHKSLHNKLRHVLHQIQK